MPKDDETTTPTPEDPKPRAAGTGANTLAITNRLLDAAEKDDERKERETKLLIETLERSVVLWQRVTMALITVLLVLVSGVVGVSVSGKLPGIGDIKIEQSEPKGENDEPAPEPELEPVEP